VSTSLYIDGKYASTYWKANVIFWRALHPFRGVPLGNSSVLNTISEVGTPLPDCVTTHSWQSRNLKV